MLDGAVLFFWSTFDFEVVIRLDIIVRGGVEDEVYVEDPCFLRGRSRVIVVAAEGEDNRLVSVRISYAIFFIPHAYIMLKQLINLYEVKLMGIDIRKISFGFLSFKLIQVE